MTYGELYREVARVALFLREAGVQAGDRVAGFMPNMPETVAAMLAAASIGAIWSSCSPDFGIKGVLDRFGQITPKVLFTADGYQFKGRRIDCRERVRTILDELPTIERVVVVPYTEERPHIGAIPGGIRYGDLPRLSATGAWPLPSFPRNIPSTSCTPRARRAYRNASSRAPGASWRTT